ncbi:MAG: type III-A CRISPR-associated protein Cas10/Csm1, partial [Sphaerospermopsis kisseleviana]
MMKSYQVTLQILQQAIAVLANWVKSDVVNKLSLSASDSIDDAVKEAIQEAIQEAQKILFWPKQGEPQALRLLFDYVNLNPEEKQKKQTKEHYWIPEAIDNNDPKIPYPVTKKPDLESLKKDIKTALDSLEQKDYQNLSLLTLIVEKFGSFISFGEENIALIDLVKSTAAVAAALVNNTESKNITLIAGDLSGIQKFIYTISSDGALKSLRARSFYLELVTEEVVQQLLDKLELPRTNVIYAGGGNLYILAGDISKVNNTINYVHENINKWLMNSFQGKLFLALDWLSVNPNCLNKKEFAEDWVRINKKLAIQKNQKFKEQIQTGNLLKIRTSYEPCRVCHRDDLPKLKPLKNTDSSPACWLCINMFDLGDKLFKIKAIVRSSKSVLNKTLDKVYRLYI